MTLELWLNRSRVGSRRPCFGPGHRSRVHVIKMSVHSEGKEKVIGMPETAWVAQGQSRRGDFG